MGFYEIKDGCCCCWVVDIVADGGEIGWFGSVPICCFSCKGDIMEFIGILVGEGDILCCCWGFNFLENGDKFALFV